LEEAENPANPTLERLKFLAIFESNLDEFFMVRVSGLMEQVDAGITTLTPDGLTPGEQVEMIAEEVLPLRLRAAGLWEKSLKGELEKSNIHIRTWDSLTDTQRKNLRDLFAKQIFPIATPLILYPNPSVPFVSNRSLNLAVMLEDDDGTQKLGRVKVPAG
jgi:polyphosphate kinase